MLSPLYGAVMEWLPTARPEVEKAAVPPLRVPLPRTEVPSKNVTLPVAVAGDTVAVKVTNCPASEGLTLEVTVVAEETPHPDEQSGSPGLTRNGR